MKPPNKVYHKAYGAAQAGGMGNDDSHEFATDQASRRFTGLNRHHPGFRNLTNFTAPPDGDKIPAEEIAAANPSPEVLDAAAQLTPAELEYLFIDSIGSVEVTSPDYAPPSKELCAKAGEPLIHFLMKVAGLNPDGSIIGETSVEKQVEIQATKLVEFAKEKAVNKPTRLVRALTRELKDWFGFTITPNLANQLLWRLQSQQVLTMGGREAVSPDIIDTFTREKAADILAQQITGMPWPMGGDSERTSKIFFAKFTAEAPKHGIVLEPGFNGDERE